MTREVGGFCVCGHEFMDHIPHDDHYDCAYLLDSGDECPCAHFKAAWLR